jgi:iron complex outermembrane receptor protein
LGERWQFDITFRYVDDIPTLDVPSYLTMDMRLAWMPNKHMTLELYGRNLLQDHHAEFRDTFYPMYLLTDTEVKRSVFGKLTYRF